MDWMTDLCGFWTPCGLFLLLLFSLLSLCLSPQEWNCLGSEHPPCSFYVFGHSALKALTSPLTTHNSSYRIYTNNTPVQSLDLALLSSSSYLNTPSLGYSTQLKSRLLPSLQLARPRLRFDSFPLSGCHALLGCCWPAGVRSSEFWLYLDARTGSVVQVPRNCFPCMWNCRICSESTLYSPGSLTSSGQFQLAFHPLLPVDRQRKEENDGYIRTKNLVVYSVHSSISTLVNN